MVEVIYDDVGLASMLGQLLQQKLSDPRKAEIAKSMRGRLVIEVRDMNIAATIVFAGDRIEVRNGGGNADSVISADFQTINSLATGQVGILGVLKLMITGKLKIKGIGMARKFQEILS